MGTPQRCWSRSARWPQDEETGEVVVHGGRYRFEKDSYFEFNPAYMHEWRLTPNSQGQKKQERCLDDTPVEYPKINNQYTVRRGLLTTPAAVCSPAALTVRPARCGVLLPGPQVQVQLRCRADLDGGPERLGGTF